MENTEAIKRFVRVAELGSFTKAADALGLPKARISLAVQQLENRLGTQLPHRTTRKVQLTLVTDSTDK
jgi:DNA-binding transcriptional LysR family regulator